MPLGISKLELNQQLRHLVASCGLLDVVNALVEVCQAKSAERVHYGDLKGGAIWNQASRDIEYAANMNDVQDAR